MIDLGFMAGSTVAVLGLGRSGRAAAEALLAGGATASAAPAWNGRAGGRSAAGPIARLDSSSSK